MYCLVLQVCCAELDASRGTYQHACISTCHATARVNRNMYRVVASIRAGRPRYVAWNGPDGNGVVVGAQEDQEPATRTQNEALSPMSSAMDAGKCSRTYSVAFVGHVSGSKPVSCPVTANRSRKGSCKMRDETVSTGSMLANQTGGPGFLERRPE